MELSTQFRRFLPLVPVFLAGAILCTLAFVGARRLEQNAARAEFELASENRASALRREIDTNVAALAILRGFTELSPQLTEKAFEQFSSRTLAVYPGIRALEWIPRVTAAQRAAFEKQMRLDRRPRPEITQGNPSGNLRRAGERPEYYPVQYIYPPTEGTRNALGFDVSLSASFSRAMRRARETGQPIAAERVRLLERTSDGFGVPILLPVFRQSSSSGRGDDEELLGFVMGIFQVADILDRALKYVDPRGINIQLFDDSAPAGRRSLFFYQTRLAGRLQPPGSEEEPVNSKSLRYSSSTEVAGRRWRIVCTPSQEFVANSVSWKPWVVLVIGGLTTLLVCVYLTLNLVHNGRTERLVEELSRTNEQLNKEIGERIRIEEHLAVARDQALEASRLKSQFLANMSHEIRTPMNGIMGMNGLLLTTNLSAEQREYAEIVERSGVALLTIINDILDFSKIESGKLNIERISFSIPRLVDHILGLLSEQSKVKNIALTYSPSPDLPEYVRGDPTRVGQVLTNLIGNAIKFTEEGEVSVGITVKERSSNGVLLRFEVKDTGIGVPVEAQKLIFQSFAQADGSTTRKHGGTGLGLAISKQLVEMMQGEIGLESEPNVGSTFWFTVRLEIATTADGKLVDQQLG